MATSIASPPGLAQSRKSTPSTAAACETCRKLKMRCIRLDAVEQCERCNRNMRACVIPEPRPLGRKHGAVGKYRGVEKAIRKIRTELRKAQVSADGISSVPGLSDLASEDGLLELLQVGSSPKPSHSLQRRSEEAHGSTLSDPFPETTSFPDGDFEVNLSASPGPSALPGVVARPVTSALPPRPERRMPPSPEQCPQNEHRDGRPPRRNEEAITNPLGLVADASGEAQAHESQSIATCTSPTSITSPPKDPEPCSFARKLLSRPGYISLGLKVSRQSLERGLDALFSHPGLSDRCSNYFKPADTTKAPDTGPDVDPVDLGLVTMEEAHYLFPIYFARLHPFNGILDPLLHTPEFVRLHSALLFTWILAITAQFDVASEPMAKRLRLHGENLSKHVHTNGYRSVEIAQGYYISLLSPTPARTMSEERSWIYTNYAFGMAAELVLDHQPGSHRQSAKPTRPPSPHPPSKHVESGPESQTDSGFPQSTTSGDQGMYYRQRLVRNRERTWLRILLWERAHSSARGRMNSFPEMELTRRIEEWWAHPLAHAEDRHTCAFILLRRQLALLHENIKEQADNDHADPHWVRDLVDSTLSPWRREWLPAPDSFTTPTNPVSNIFLKYVYSHARLWTLSFALHGPTSGRTYSNSTREDCFEAAVDCCETAVRTLQKIGEPLYCMLAPTWAMISYAAVLALKLFPSLYGNRAGYEVELLALISQVALQLEIAGTTPSHRFGIAALLGQHLFHILRTRAAVLKESTDSNKEIGSKEAASSRQWPSAPSASVNVFASDNQALEFGDPGQLYDPLLYRLDPFMTTPFQANEFFLLDESYVTMQGEWFGQGFGALV